MSTVAEMICVALRAAKEPLTMAAIVAALPEPARDAGKVRAAMQRLRECDVLFLDWSPTKAVWSLTPRTPADPFGRLARLRAIAEDLHDAVIDAEIAGLPLHTIALLEAARDLTARAQQTTEPTT